VYIIWLAQFLAITAFSFVMPFIPFFIRELGVTSENHVAIWSGLLVTGSGLTLALVSPLWGTLADRYGRKVMVQRAMFGGAVTLSLMGLVTNVHQLLALRLLQGAVTGTVTAALALVSSITPKEHRGYTLGLMQMSIFAGAAIGPYLGGSLADHFGYRLPFAITGLLLFAAGALVMFGVQEPRQRNGNGDAKATQATLSQLLHMQGFPTLLAVFFLVSFAGMVVAPVFPLFVEKLLPNHDRVASMTGLLLAAGGVVSGIGAVVVGRFADRIGYRTLLFACTLCSGLSCTGQAMAASLSQLFIIRVLFGFVAGGTGPTMNALVASSAPDHAYGRAYGLTTSASSVGTALGPLLGGLIACWLGLRAPFIVTGVMLMAISAAIALRIRAKGPQ